MKKMMKLLVCIALIGTMIAVGVFAASTAKHTTTLTVNYKSNHAAVKIDFTLTGASSTTYRTYDGTADNDTSVAASPTYNGTWGPTVNFDDPTATMTFTAKFSNYGSRAVTVNADLTANDSVVFATPTFNNDSGGAAYADGTGIAGKSGSTVTSYTYTVKFTLASAYKNKIVDGTVATAPEIEFTITAKAA